MAKKKRLFLFEVCNPYDVYFKIPAENGKRQFKPKERLIGNEDFLYYVGKYLSLVAEVTNKNVEEIEVGAKMFEIEEFKNVVDADKYIRTILKSLDATTSKRLEFQIIHSLSETECSEDGGSLELISNMLLSYLRDLDSQQGYVIFDNDHWDFIDWDEPCEVINVHRPLTSEETFVSAGEGIVVIHNKLALCESQFPILVIKKNFWGKYKDGILPPLKIVEYGEDYTAKISPALYVELFHV